MIGIACSARPAPGRGLGAALLLRPQTELEAFRAAAASYRSSGRFKGIMTVPTLILIGERDDWGTANACRKMVAGEDDVGISRQKGEGAPARLIVFPDAYFGFDKPTLETPIEFLGHHLEYNQISAAAMSACRGRILESASRGEPNTASILANQSG